MKRLLACAASGAALFAAAPAFAANHPSFRYCEAGYINQQVDFDETATAGSVAAALEADSGSGFRAACAFELLMGLYLHGEYQQADIDFDAVFTDGVDTDQFSSDVNSSSLRIGAGFAFDIPLVPVTPYGQVSYTQVEFDADSVVSETVGAVEGFEEDDSGFDIEAGVRTIIMNRFDLGAFGRYSDVGSLSAGTTFDDIENDEDFRYGAQAAVRVIGPFWGSLRYEGGDVDTLFVGGRVAF